MRRATIVRSVITGNLANDDGGGVYARRGGVEVFHSIVSANLVDGSGGAIGRPATSSSSTLTSTGTRPTATGARSTPTRMATSPLSTRPSTAIRRTARAVDLHPGGRRDDHQLDGQRQPRRRSRRGDLGRGRRIRHRFDARPERRGCPRGRRVWARDDLYVTNSTIARNSAEGVGGGLFAAGELGLVHSTVLDNAAPVAGSLAAGDGLTSFGSIIGPTNTGGLGGRFHRPRSTAASDGRIRRLQLHQRPLLWAGASTDLEDAPDPQLAALADNGGAGETRMPATTSPLIDAIPIGGCIRLHSGTASKGNSTWRLRPRSSGVVEADQRGAVRPGGQGCEIERSKWGRTDAPPVRLLSMSRRSPPFRTGSPTSPPMLRILRTARSRGAGWLGRPSSDLKARAARISRGLKPMERSGRRFRRWLGCITPLRVSEFGDPDHRFGFRYDELDGGGRTAARRLPATGAAAPISCFSVLPSPRVRKRRDGAGRHR